jgi:hypothetical protein
MLRACLGLVLLVGCEPELIDSAEDALTRNMVRATRVTTSNADDLLLVGPRSDGEVGHWAITNGSLSAVIDATGFDEDLGVPLQHHRSPTGGTLVDLAPPGGRDALAQVVQVISYDPDVRVYYQSVTVEEQGKALRAIGRILDPERKLGVALDEDDLVEQLVVTTTWRMWDRQPWVEVETAVSNQTGRAVEIGPVVDLIVTDGLGSTAFVPSPGLGFGLEDEQAVLAPWLALAGSPDLGGSFAVLSLEDQHLHILPDMDQGGRVRGVYVGQEDRNKDSIAPGEQRAWTRRYTASAGEDLAGVTQHVLELLALQEGNFHFDLGISDSTQVLLELDALVPAQVMFHRIDPARYLDPEGRVQDGGVMPLSATWYDGVDPSIGTWLSLGTYQVEIESPGFSGEPVELQVEPGLEEYGRISLLEQALTPVALSLVDAAGAPNSAPLRLTVMGLGGTPDLDLGRFALAGGALAAGRRIWTSAAEVELLLPEGAYRIIASRGPRFPLVSAELRVPDQDAVALDLDGPAFENDGWVAVDPFTASSSSIFGGDAGEDIAFALCGEGIDLLVRAEAGGGENADPGCEGQQAVAGALGTLDVPRTGVGQGDGWLVAFPVTETLPGPGLRAGDWLDLAWASGAQATAILAPRARGAAGAAKGMFDARDFLRERIDDGEVNRFLREVSEAGTTGLDAGAIELLTPADPWHSAAMVNDWLALLEAGYRLHPVASSHSSWLQVDNPGAARTMVRSDSTLVEERLAALAAGHTLATSGPWLEVTVQGNLGSAGPGDSLAAAPGSDLQLELTLQAPSWIPVDRVRVFVNGSEVWSTELEGEGPTAFTQILDLESPGTGWIVVDAGRTDQLPEGDYALVYPDMPIYAVTAPIWLDTSGK